ncbi:transcriptional regulator [candidate division WOR-3 bacterium]|nr:transcriptional regulator [candidate division WOR-3 bacterium]
MKKLKEMEKNIVGLVKIVASVNFIEVINFLRNNPGTNSSFIAGKLGLHILTVQRILDELARDGFVETEEKRGVGRPSIVYAYIGGSFQVDLDKLLRQYEYRSSIVREKGDGNIRYSYDVDKEIVNAVIIGGRRGKKIKLDQKMGKVLWYVPPPDSEGASVESIAKEVSIQVFEAVQYVLQFIYLNIIEEVKK